MSDQLRGIFPIVYTPFDLEGRIDEEDLFKLVDYLIAAGTHGLAACGGASESNKMPVSERKWLAERTIAAARGRVPTIVGISAACTADSVELARHAEATGAVGLFCTPPLYGTMTPEGYRAHFGSIARATALPILIQDALVVVPPPQIQKLGAEFPNLKYIKEEALDSGHRITELLTLCKGDITILSGGSYLVDDLARGAVGAIPGSIGVADLSRCFDLYRAGDLVGARRAYDHFLPLSYWRRQFGTLGAKEVLRRVGVFKVASNRLPANERLDDYDMRELDAIMETMGPPY